MPEGQDNHPPPPLSDAYRKTRRWYTFLSALLLTYALIGFEVVQKPSETPKEVSDHSLVIPIQALGNVGIKFQNPNAFPWVIGLLVIFFAYRTYIEWLMCSVETPKYPAKVDHHVSQSLGVVALAVPIIQFLLDIRVAEYLPQANLGGAEATFWMITTGIGSGTFFQLLWLYWGRNFRSDLPFFKELLWVTGFVSLATSFWLFISYVGSLYFAFIPILLCGMGFGLAPFFMWLSDFYVKFRNTFIPKHPMK